MFARVLVAIDDVSQIQDALDLVKGVAVPGKSEVRALHLRLREVAGFRWYSRETRAQASFVAEAATFELRMAGRARGSATWPSTESPRRSSPRRKPSTPISSCSAAQRAGNC
jgi:hypothetical protein